MKLTAFVALLAVGLAEAGPVPSGSNWALLVASSNGWYNYRHQADICHAYHVLINNGFRADRIITMMYDDVAHHEQNPHKGKLFNRPGGPDVYEGCVLDYTGKEVNVQNVLSVLSGDKQGMKGHGNGRVIESGPDDHVFVNIVDHGTTGALCFPNSEYMYADQLSQTLKTMKKNKRYSKMVIYLEACEGGSMFDNIIDDRNDVFVSTAAAPAENSFAYYCGTEVGCMGDAYSVIWMEHMDKLRENWSDRYVSLFKQYKYVRTNVNKSHVMVYGDFRLGFDRLSGYFGDNGAYKRKLVANSDMPVVDPKPVPSRDVVLYTLEQKFQETNSDDEEKDKIYREIQEIKKGRRMVDETMERLVANVAGDDTNLLDEINNSRRLLQEEQFPCYRGLIDEFNNVCFSTYKNQYILNHFYKLANMCALGIAQDHFSSALGTACPDHVRNLNGAH